MERRPGRDHADEEHNERHREACSSGTKRAGNRWRRKDAISLKIDEEFKPKYALPIAFPTDGPEGLQIKVKSAICSIRIGKTAFNARKDVIKGMGVPFSRYDPGTSCWLVRCELLPILLKALAIQGLEPKVKALLSKLAVDAKMRWDSAVGEIEASFCRLEHPTRLKVEAELRAAVAVADRLLAVADTQLADGGQALDTIASKLDAELAKAARLHGFGRDPLMAKVRMRALQAQAKAQELTEGEEGRVTNSVPLAMPSGTRPGEELDEDECMCTGEQTWQERNAKLMQSAVAIDDDDVPEEPSEEALRDLEDQAVRDG